VHVKTRSKWRWSEQQKVHEHSLSVCLSLHGAHVRRRGNVARLPYRPTNASTPAQRTGPSARRRRQSGR
jgi:hypothetical protein